MATNKEEVRLWLEASKELGATHVLVICDEFEWEDYPISVQPGEDLAKKAASYHGRHMQKVMECYDLSLDLETQLAEERSWHGWSPAQLIKENAL